MHQLTLTSVRVLLQNLLQKIDIGYDKEPTAGPDSHGQVVADPRLTERCHQVVLAIVDRAADAAVEARRGRRGLDLHGK